MTITEYAPQRAEMTKPTIMRRFLAKALLCACMSIMCIDTVHAQGFMHAEGKTIVDINGNEIILRGHAPGGWMIQEPYMMETQGFTSSQHTIKAKIESVLGLEDTKEFYRKWLDNGFTRNDVKLLAELGFNSIRLPMHYNLFTLPIEEEPVKGENTWKEEGFLLVDNVLQWCKEFKIYLILDMHGTPGGQGYDSAISDYDVTKPSLWESEDNKNKLIALWVKLAQRYANEQYIGGYDLINEPNWAFDGDNVNGCNENTNTQIWNIYKRLIDAIRTVDKNHMIILEGNCWCNNFNGLPYVRNWDDNLCLQFHKYWSVNDKASIQFILNLRESKNLPIWCGESGENSNKWYTDAVRLLEENGIGWSWWTWKKLSSTSGIATAKAPAGYEALKNYWKNGGNKPSQATARTVLFNLADAYLLENCTINKAVADALLRQPHTTALMPYADNKVPGTIYAPDYDLGRYGEAYVDLDGAETTHSSGGDHVAWNKGWAYRSDGVDIEKCNDSYSNGYSVGWTSAGEWMKYTIDVAEDAAYRLSIRYASNNTNTKMKFEIDGTDITSEVNLISTGGWTTWKSADIGNIVLKAGKHVMKVTTTAGGANLASYSLTQPVPTTNVKPTALSAKSSADGRHIYLSVNKPTANAEINTEDFIVKTDNLQAGIDDIQISQTDDRRIDITLSAKIYSDNNVTISYKGTSITDSDGMPLSTFTDMMVDNIAERRAIIPGRINVEDYNAQQGLAFETCNDTSGGATNFGYTDPGDYIDFIVNIKQEGDYTLQYRTAALNTGGRFELQIIDEQNNITTVGTYNVNATGGWQTWQTQTGKAKLPKGTYKLRIYIVSKEFNMNWFGLDIPTAIGTLQTASFSVHPTICHDVVNICTTQMTGSATITIYSTTGAVAYRHDHRLGGCIAIDMHNIEKGTYILQMKNKYYSHTQKIIRI